VSDSRRPLAASAAAAAAARSGSVGSLLVAAWRAHSLWLRRRARPACPLLGAERALAPSPAGRRAGPIPFHSTLLHSSGGRAQGRRRRRRRLRPALACCCRRRRPVFRLTRITTSANPNRRRHKSSPSPGPAGRPSARCRPQRRRSEERENCRFHLISAQPEWPRGGRERPARAGPAGAGRGSMIAGCPAAQRSDDGGCAGRREARSARPMGRPLAILSPAAPLRSQPMKRFAGAI